ncbi:hypothetical protein PENTCL1PPCAC_17738 [Pristionchus entomophagus]|uniref:protein adenylyltransferase n=1 Tax=Pristionchus entomophagus TaxID=358040 RepID=A0AAV5TMB4_9BILA|nr:hypothetical protein PENTCL1PPCAC_17738 [Pristionchus entomophagus]
MVDESGRLRIVNTRRASSSENAPNVSLCRLIFYIFTISVIVQYVLPSIHSFIADQLSRKRLKSTANLIGISDVSDRIKASYLVEPFPIERWRGVTSRDIVRKVSWEDSEVSVARESEALTALSAALNALKNGNSRKCKTIMDHALALCPNHPDILAEYGVYLETIGEDIVEADGLFTKALALNPHQSTALTGRERTRSVVAEMDENELKELRTMRDSFASLPHSTVIRRVMRESYFAHVYHTVAIEGNTLTLGETRVILETNMPIAGRSLFEHNEVLGMDAALRYLNRSLIERNDITIEDILEIHRHVLGHVSPVNAGRLRSTQVYVGRFTPVAPSEVMGQMEELIEWLNCESTAEMEPVERAAIAHYKLVLVHPFVDGNGRTSRLLMNLLLMRSGFPPVILPVEDKAMYFATLHTANLGDLRPFVRFVAKHTRNTLQKYLELSSTCNSIECQQAKESSENTECENCDSL